MDFPCREFGAPGEFMLIHDIRMPDNKGFTTETQRHREKKKNSVTQCLRGWKSLYKHGSDLNMIRETCPEPVEGFVAENYFWKS